jgi:hypothetical protein
MPGVRWLPSNGESIGMRFKRTFIIFLVFPVCLSLTIQVPAALHGQVSGAGSSAKSRAAEDRMLQPSDIFQDFPEIGWEMSFQDVKKAVEKTGAHPVGFKNSETELAWDSTFNDMKGRGTVLFREGGGVYEIAVIVYAMEKRKEVFEQMMKKVIERHGAAHEEADTSIDTSKVWRLKNGFVIELRLLKDDNSPVVDIHWVKG